MISAIIILLITGASVTLSFAGTGRWTNPTKNYISYGDLSAASKNPNSPHGNYTTATNKCSFCHAVHNAGTDYNGLNVWKLTRTNGDNEAMGACKYCHVSGSVSVKLPYNYTGGAAAPARARHSIDGTATVIPDSTVPGQLGANGYLDCLDCHNAAPHGAGNVYKLTKDVGASSSMFTPICKRCHDKNFVDENDPWDKQSHPMVESTDGMTRPDRAAAGRQVVGAGWDTRDCKRCHANGGSAGLGSFPHISRAARFLQSSAGDLTADGSGGQLDVICLQCHRFGAGEGVGLTY